MNQVHIVEGHVAYEGSRILKVFSDKDEADALAKAGNDHNSTYPECPSLLSEDGEWLEFDKLKNKWNLTHPIKDGYASEEYHVSSYDVEP
jgi:hypothetical protein